MTIILDNFHRLKNKYNLSDYLETDNDITYTGILSQHNCTEFFDDCQTLGSSFTLKYTDTTGDSHQIRNNSDIKLFKDVSVEGGITLTLKFKKLNLIDSAFTEKFNIFICSNIDWIFSRINKKSITEIESYLFNNSKPCIICTIDKNHIGISNGTISITCLKELVEYDSKWESIFNEGVNKFTLSFKHLRKRNENNYWNDYTTKFSPICYYFNNVNFNCDLKKYFDKLFISNAIGFLAKYTQLNIDSGYTSIFKGLKNINVSHTFNNIEIKLTDIENLNSLFEWVYADDGHTADKINLLQNIVGLQLKTDSPVNEFIKISKEIRESTQENFKAFIDKSLDEFLAQRKEYEDLIQRTSDSMGEQVTNVSSLMNKNLYGLIAASITSTFAISRGLNFQFVPITIYIYVTFIFILTIYFVSYSYSNIRSKDKFYTLRRNEFKKYFSEERLVELEGELIKDQKIIFKRYVIITCIINTLLIMAGILIALSFQFQVNFVKVIFNFILLLLTKLFFN
ncbi:hypothetical protein ABES25_24025 [Bacillus gobiensis]|uniref:hypothetical protein n=1 Tax=Bacillus gobiensis TaxID=1441095 RepID=UPI003D1A204C